MPATPACRALGSLLCWTFLAVSPAPAVAAGPWEPVGPEGGPVVSLALDPSSPETLYAATGGGGIFKSTDRAATWSHASAGLSPRRARAVAVDPQTPATLYATVSGDGVYKSTDAARTWQPANAGLPANAEGQVLAVDPSSPATLYVSIFPNDGEGVYRSADGGATWTRLGLEERATALAVDPSRGTVYAGAANGRVFRSDDEGAIWRLASGGLSTGIGAVRALAVHPAGQAVYAGAEAGVFRSANRGDSWQRASNGLTGPVQTLLLHPGVPRVVYAGTGLGLYRSTDQGRHWSPFGTGLDRAEVLSLAIDAQRLTFHAGTGRLGVLRATAGGIWTPANRGLRAVPADALALDPKRPGTIFLASPSGLFKTADGGATWRRLLEAQGEVTSLVMDPERPATVYFQDAAGHLYQTRDGGASFAPRTIPGLGQGLAVAPGSPSTLYAGDRRTVWRSVDGGRTWAMPQDPGPLSCIWVGALAVPPGRPDQVLAAGAPACFANQGGGVARSLNNGRTWSPSLLGSSLGVLAFDPEDPQAVHAGGEALIVSGGDTPGFVQRRGVFASTDGGATWAPLPAFGDGLHPAQALAAPRGRPGTLYAGTSDFKGGVAGEEGVFETTDGGLTWTPLDDGLTSLDIRDLEAAPQDSSTLYAATAGGLFRLIGNAVHLELPNRHLPIRRRR
jgi:photosystem II stability/assembly factor-like uncharacterized protein